MLKHIRSPKWYIPPGYAGIDYAAWDTPPADYAGTAEDYASDPDAHNMSNYFYTYYSKPPLLDPQDKTGLLLGQLTHRQVRNLESLRSAEPDAVQNSDWIDYALRYGVKDWSGLALVDEDGNITQVQPEFEDSEDGKRLTSESLDTLHFFYPVVCMQLTASHIYIYSVT